MISPFTASFGPSSLSPPTPTGYANLVAHLVGYELPTLPNYGWLQRNFIDGGMRGGIPDKAVRARTITLYLDVRKFNTALNLATIDDIYVLLVDRLGEVLWRANGDYTSQKGDTLSQRLAELFTPTAEAGQADVPDQPGG